MGLGSLLLKHHAKLAVPAFCGSIGFGFWYTMEHGRTPIADLQAWAYGKPAEEQPIRAMTFRLR